MHEILETINNEDNSAISQATKLPRILLFKKEKGDLRPLPRKEVMAKYHLSFKQVHVSNESMISYKSNKYSVPKKYIGSTVSTVVINNELYVYDNNKIITKHKITNILLNIKPEHQLTYDQLETSQDKLDNTQIRKELENILYD